MLRLDRSLSRRDFLKLTGLGMGIIVLRPRTWDLNLPEWPQADLLGRNCSGGKIAIRTRPDITSPTVREIYEDTVLPWLQEVNADNPDYNRINQRWVETPEGYVYASDFQPCRNLPNQPLQSVPQGKSGFWAEVTVPFVDIYLDNPPARSPGVRAQLDQGVQPRLYYSQVVWIDQVRTSDAGTVLYHFNEDAGHGFGYGDVFWAEGVAFRPLTGEDVSPIHPEVDPATKKIVVNVTYQTLSCLEGQREVYFCRVSTGREASSTPVGEDYSIWRKSLSIHMSGGNLESGYDGPAISWTTFFMGEGVAIHGATWHNDFGMARSHGCVNCRPEDARWIFRWTLPVVDLETSDVTWSDWQKGSTHVKVEERLF